MATNPNAFGDSREDLVESDYFERMQKTADALSELLKKGFVVKKIEV